MCLLRAAFREVLIQIVISELMLIVTSVQYKMNNKDVGIVQTMTKIKNKRCSYIW